MATQWAAEACDQRYDPESGAMIVYLTSSSAASTNIYCEQPYTSPDGNRLAIVRRHDISFDKGARLLVADLTTLKLALIEPDGVGGVCNAAWSGKLHYTLADGTLMQLDLQTLEKAPRVLPDGTPLRGGGSSISPDQRYLVASRVIDGPAVAIYVVDLETGREQVILEDPELVNPHLQFNPVHGRDILVQHNRGARLAADGTIERIVSDQGTTHFIIAADGTNRRPLACGPPHTGTSTGHSNFVADTGRACWTTHWNQDDWSCHKAYPMGNVFTAAPGDEKPTVFRCPEHRFNHINASRCGRYFIGDSVSGSMYDAAGVIRNPQLVIGNFETGKYRVLVADTGGPAGGGQHTHPHAYLTADNRAAIYNAAALGAPTQVCAARVSEDFLGSLS